MSGASKIILGLAVVLIVAAAAVVYVNRDSISFAVFHTPINLASARSTYNPPVTLPRFTVSNQISPDPSRGQALTVQVTATSNIRAVGFVEVWVSGPGGKEVYKSPSDQPDDFVGGTPSTFNFSYILPVSLNSGTYSISEIITSFSNKTDYYANEDFAKFTLQ